MLKSVSSDCRMQSGFAHGVHEWPHPLVTELSLGYTHSSENCQLLDQLSFLVKPHPKPKQGPELAIIPSQGSSKVQTTNRRNRRKIVWKLQEKPQAMGNQNHGQRAGEKIQHLEYLRLIVKRRDVINNDIIYTTIKYGRVQWHLFFNTKCNRQWSEKW